MLYNREEYKMCWGPIKLRCSFRTRWISLTNTVWLNIGLGNWEDLSNTQNIPRTVVILLWWCCHIHRVWERFFSPNRNFGTFIVGGNCWWSKFVLAQKTKKFTKLSFDLQVHVQEFLPRHSASMVLDTFGKGRSTGKSLWNYGLAFKQYDSVEHTRSVRIFILHKYIPLLGTRLTNCVEVCAVESGAEKLDQFAWNECKKKGL